MSAQRRLFTSSNQPRRYRKFKRSKRRQSERRTRSDDSSEYRRIIREERLREREGDDGA